MLDVVLALVASVLWGSSYTSLELKNKQQPLSSLFIQWFSAFATCLVCFPVLCLQNKFVSEWTLTFHEPENAAGLFLYTTFGISANFCYLYAMTKTNRSSIIVAATSTYPLVTMFLNLIFFGQFKKIWILGILLIISGNIVLCFF